MRWLLALLGVLLGLIGLIYGLELGSLATQLGQARAEVAAQQRSLARAEASLSAAVARIGGSHRDLITCADWLNLFLQVNGTDSAGGQLAASAGPPSLPEHCVNQ